jgi:adenosylmethionine-8-amino-7-oxononanoate aminotransferase
MSEAINKSGNSQLLEDDKKYVWHPFTQELTAQNPLEIIRAEGATLIDSKGKEYIDANSSWWVNVHGHGHPHIGKALEEQFKTIDHVVFAGVTHPKAVELAKRIVEILPDHFSKVFFSDNGSTSVEVALKMAFQYFHNQGISKHRILAMHGAYHGDTFGAMSVGQRGYFNAPFEPYFFDVDYIDFPERENEEVILTEAEGLFESGEFAAMIVEPLVQGAAGMRMYSRVFLDRLTSLARKHDVLVIFDEVMTGFGRTGKLFAMDYCVQKPDIVALSKGLTGGVMALGLTVATEKIYNAFLSNELSKAFLHGHSFTANPIACAVACASLDLFESEATWVGINNVAMWHENLANILREDKYVTNVRQQGTILAFDISINGENSYFSSVRDKAYQFFLERGVLLRPLGNTIFINAPYCLSKGEYEKIRVAIHELLDLLNSPKI